MADDGRERFTIPIAFCCGGISHCGFAEGFEILSDVTERGSLKTCREIVYRRLADRTEWTVRKLTYPAYRAVEWQAEVYAPCKTGVYSEVGYCFDVPGENGVLSGNYGDKDGEYAEYCTRLSRGGVRQETEDGRPTHRYFPYYRLETDAEKAIVVLSWQGTWYAEFRQERSSVRIRAGQAGVSCYWNAGERFRLPTMVFLSYDSDPINAWRRFMIDCNLPAVHGEMPKPRVGVFNGQCEGLNDAVVRRIKEAYDRGGIDYDLWWFDAGWGTDGTGAHNWRDQWWHGVNFEMNFEAFPDGLASFGKQLAEEGKDFLLWFEAEAIRTPPAEWEAFFKAHPDFDRSWILGVYQYEWCGQILTAQLLDLGNDACRSWLEEKIFAAMDRAGATAYRQDFNIPPAPVWRSLDQPDRRGMAENRYCTGYLRFLRDICDRYGGLLMDSCASGGGRCDLETMRLMVPLHYSDYQDVHPADADTRLYMSQILFRWFPYFKNAVNSSVFADSYRARSAFAPLALFSLTAAETETADFGALKRWEDDWKKIRRHFYGDYYEPEAPSCNDTDVKAYAFCDRDRRAGFAVVLCPSSCTRTDYRLIFRELERNCRYRVDCDTRESRTLTGAALCTEGISFAVQSTHSYLFRFEAIG